jgi:hypothetical protein
MTLVHLKDPVDKLLLKWVNTKFDCRKKPKEFDFSITLYIMVTGIVIRDFDDADFISF